MSTMAAPARPGPDGRPPGDAGIHGPPVLTRARINRLSHIDRVTGEPRRRHEHEHPGSLFHVDVTIPDGGGWQYVGKAQGDRNRSATVARTGTSRSPLIGTAFVHTVFVHTVIDDLSDRLHRDPRR